MQITQKTIGLVVDASLMRLHLAMPSGEGPWPGVLFFSDIYQLGAPMLRLANRLAGYGYVVAAPEIFHRTEVVGTVIEPDDIGRLRGNDNARRTAINAYDADAEAIVAWLSTQPKVLSEQLGCLGFCIGGHLAFRAALQPQLKATACVYPTGLTEGKLGMGVADSLQRAAEISGALMTVFGSEDPHVPPDAREMIQASLANVPGLRHQSMLFNANHTFMRDDGYRWDPELADQAWRLITGFFASHLQPAHEQLALP